jgi:hypothetical protein
LHCASWKLAFNVERGQNLRSTWAHLNKTIFDRRFYLFKHNIITIAGRVVCKCDMQITFCCQVACHIFVDEARRHWVLPTSGKLASNNYFINIPETMLKNQQEYIEMLKQRISELEKAVQIC